MLKLGSGIGVAGLEGQSGFKTWQMAVTATLE